MSAAYDNFDYPSYWIGREYEHACEFLAIKKLLLKIPRIKRSIEIGAGFGRLLSSYKFRVKNIVLSEPSIKLIAKAKRQYQHYKNIEFVRSNLNNLKNKTRTRSFDLCIMVRVLHHIEDVDKAFENINNLLRIKGYLILEFPNKSHLKASLKKIISGDMTYPINIFPIDIRSKKNIKHSTLPFMNFHPDQILEKLKSKGFEIIEVRSVSNIRSTFMKKFFPLSFLLDLESMLQIPLSKLNFGPSYFVLAKKRTNLLQ